VARLRPHPVILIVVLCLQVRLPAQGPLELGQASGEPGEKVEVPVIATFEHPLALISFPLDYDPSRLLLTGYGVTGTAAEGVDPDALTCKGVFLRGDSNRDDLVDMSDAVATLLFLVGGKPPPCEDAADADDDGTIGVADAVTTIRHLFLGDGPLKAPGTSYPWLDPTPDSLACRE
jgi:hypothetical protein